MALSPVFGTEGSIHGLLDPSILREFRGLDQGGKSVVEYVWIDGTGQTLRSKCRVLSKPPTKPEDCPVWNFDGSSTGQAPGDDSEVYLVARRLFKDPFRGPGNFLAMCDCHIPPQVDQEGNKISEMVPHPGNSRAPAAAIFEKCKAQKPWFGIEQEYTLLAPNSLWPVGWPKNGYPGPQGPYYCAAGAGASIARDVADLHLKICLYAGVNISGVNGEVMPAQWEYQVGPCEGIDMGDELWMSRYLLYRVCEMYNVIVTFDPKPIPGDWNGAGGHTNYSNEDTRKPEVGFENIKKQIEKLKKKHAEHIAAYGEGNERRLTGLHETSSMNDFSWGVANRGCSIRVGRMVPVEKCGYYEDRRPASNLDPYVVTGKIAETTLLG